MNILFLSDNYYPETNAPAQRTQFHCEHWVKKFGCNVDILTCAPNFPYGKVYQGYKNKFYQREGSGNLVIHRIWTFIAKNKGTYLRILDFLSFMFMSIILSYKVRKPDVVIATSPQFFTLISGLVIAKITRCQLILEIRDIWPASIVAVGAIKNQKLIKLLLWLEKYLYRKADLVVVVSDWFQKDLVQKGAHQHKIVTITNGVDLLRFKNKDELFSLKSLSESERQKIAGKRVITYIGTVGLAHDVGIILRVAKLLKGYNYHFIIAGTGAEKSTIIKMSAGLSNVTVLPALDLEAVAQLHLYSDANIVHLRKSEVFKSVLPSKIFESIAGGTPILLGVDGAARELVEERSVGLFFEPENEKDLCHKITELFHSPVTYEGYVARCKETAKAFDRRILADNMYIEIQKLIDIS